MIERHEREIAFKQALIDKLTHEMAVLKRLKFAAKSEQFASTPSRRACWKRRWTPTWRRWPARSSGCGADSEQPATSDKKQPKRAAAAARTCRDARSATSPRTPPAAAAAR